MRKTGVLILVLLVLAIAMLTCEKEKNVPAEASQEVLSNPSDATALNQGSKEATDSQAGSTDVGKPRIIFDQKDFDFGKVESGEKVEKVYKFRNNGDGTLLIQKVRSG